MHFDWENWCNTSDSKKSNLNLGVCIVGMCPFDEKCSSNSDNRNSSTATSSTSFFSVFSDHCSVYKVHCECGKSLRVVFYDSFKRLCNNMTHSSGNAAYEMPHLYLLLSIGFDISLCPQINDHLRNRINGNVKSFVKMYLII